MKENTNKKDNDEKLILNNRDADKKDGKIDGYIILNDSKIDNQKILNDISNLKTKNNIKPIESITMLTEVYIEIMKNNLDYFQDIIKKFVEINKSITDAIIKFQIKMTPYFKGLGEAFQKAKKNPDSLMNWINYYQKLVQYLWVFPFDMTSEELKNLLENVNSEEEFDKYMIQYFNKNKIEKLKEYILLNLPFKHRVTFKQIMNSFYNKNYALSNIGITAIIDDLCTYFLKDKGTPKRENLFMPIIEEIDNDFKCNYDIIPLLIINSNINRIYERIDFNSRISIKTHKKTRRNTNQHGIKFVNKKIDTIMLLNTVYYLLLVEKIHSKYKGKIIYVRNQTEIKMAKVINRKETPGFYIRKKYYRTKK